MKALYSSLGAEECLYLLVYLFVCGDCAARESKDNAAYQASPYPLLSRSVTAVSESNSVIMVGSRLCGSSESKG